MAYDDYRIGQGDSNNGILSKLFQNVGERFLRRTLIRAFTDGEDVKATYEESLIHVTRLALCLEGVGLRSGDQVIYYREKPLPAIFIFLLVCIWNRFCSYSSHSFF